MKKLSDVQRLRDKRSNLLSERERIRLRELYGKKYVGFVNSAMGKSLSLDDFDSSKAEPIYLDWARNLSDSKGLVSANVGRGEVERFLICARQKVGTLSGMLGFHDKHYLGLATLDNVEPSWLLAVAESAEDSVVFYNVEPRGVIMVDYYTSYPDNPFSMIVQGDDLVSSLADC